jgi:hypothetical protein
MRIPIRPGVKLSILEPQNPEAVRVRMAAYYKPLKLTRLLSKRGWFVLLARYDWRNPGTYQPPSTEDLTDAPLTADEAWEEVARIGLDLYRAQDAVAFVGECCDIADREGRTISTAQVRKWLKGPQCARQAGLVINPDSAPAAPAEEETS